jgi:predicted HTH domain antitoxin
MSFRSLTTALELYRSGTLTLDEAADRAGVSPTKLTAELRARGIQIDSDETGAEFGR